MIKREEIFVNKAYWANFNEVQLKEFAEKIFNFYRQNGFPYYQTDEAFRKKEFDRLMKYDIRNIISNDVVQQTMHGLGLAWSYFPHSFEVKCSNKKSPFEAFHDNEIFKKVIDKRLKIGTYISDAGILKMLKLYSTVQAVSNFRPTAAAGLYKMFADDGVVWDMSGGWGGRLLGAIRANVKYYMATEPSIKTYHGLFEMIEDLNFKDRAHIICSGSEDVLPDKESLDFCFTSPPYFDLEKYSSSPTQSYIRFDKKEEWIEGFLFKTFQNCYHGLKKGKHMAINIADPKRNNTISLEKATVDYAEKCGFKHIKTMKLALSNPVMSNRTSAFKYEPIFIFKK